MNKIYLLFVCCFLNLAAFATGTTYYPISVTAPYGGTAQTICQNGMNTAISVTYSVCGTSIASGGTLSVMATWYLNGVVIYPDPTPHSITTATGTITLAAGKFSYGTYGVFTAGSGLANSGLYCALSWTTGGTSPCTFIDSAAGATTDITVNETPTPITGTASACTGTSSTLADAVTAGGTPVWTSSNTTIATVDFASGAVTANTAGTATITYKLGSGCYATTTFTANQTPAAISGIFSVCSGTLHVLSDANTGGTWTSSFDTVATIGSATGNLVASLDTGLASGVTTISYTLAAGCSRSVIVTVNETPSVITGPGSVCSGSSITLNDSVSGGVWTSSNTAIASVNFSSGVVTGAATSGNVRITYELNSGCYSTTGLITVNPLPAGITGVESVCVNSLTSLSDATTGGFWTASNSNIVIGSGSGFVTGTGATAGLDTMYYTLNTGCYKSVIVTVNPLPASISGADSVCQGSTTALTDGSGGGTWSSSTTTVATIATSGVVTGVAAGVTTISYKLSTGCLGTTGLTVNPLPATILGATSLCTGSNITLSDLTGGGTWSSSNLGVAGIGSSSAVVDGNSPGTATISYTLSITGCATSKEITVNTTPSIFGSTAVCIGTSIQLTDNVAGGTWTSSSTAIATVSAAGLVTGISSGNVTISYKVTTGCMTTYLVTVNSNPVPITGTTHVCVGSITALTDASTLGTWSSSSTADATVDAFGNVSGVAAGIVTISYVTTATACMTTTRVTVNALPAAISGLGSVCIGSTLSLSDVTALGTWSSANTTIGTISTTGIVAGLSQGTDVINYTITATGCISSTTITVNPLPATITGIPDVCIGSITSLSDDTAGGAWISSNTAKATVDGSGNVSGVAAGTTTITYALTATTGCQTKINVTVNALPGAINGLTSVCVLSTISLTDATTGGTWSSGNTSTATISSTGVVTGVGAGVVSITYTSAAGCVSATMVTVNEIPSSIMGVETVCAGGTTSLSNNISGGVWSSGTTTVATIGNSTGLVTAVNVATTTVAYTTITYELGSGCKITGVVTVDPLPAAIAGLTNVCVGFTITLSDNTVGGTWMSTNTGTATIGIGSGIVSAEAADTVTMVYTLGTGCMRTTVVNVNPLPVGIVGSPEVCIAGTTILTDPTPGGTWTSGSISTAIVGTSSGIVTGEAAGSVNITYTLSTGCDTTVSVTVNPLPGTISGPTSVCQGQNITLSDGAFIGTWVSGNTTVATIGSSTGVITGVAAGTSIVSFILTTGCYKTVTITVRQTPSAITGDTVICQTPTSGLADLTPGGTWISSNTSVASINASSGLMTPGVAGTTTITYTLSATTCYSTQGVTVNANPSVISGSTHVCVGSTTTLTDATIGGTWVSSNATFATIDATSGVATGILAGSATITYILSTGCVATMPFIVNPLPGSITGNTYVCTGATTTLHDVTFGGTWSSSSLPVASVDESTGVVTGVSTGTVTISYTPGTGCGTSILVTVNATPDPILGQLTVCTGLNDSLADSSAGGEWTTSNSSIASAGTLTGVILGVTAGNSTVTYTLGTGCFTTNLLTVYPTPAAISGPANVCQGPTFDVTLNDATLGGVWTSAETVVATVGAETGNVQGLLPGPDSIIYTVAGVCSAYKIININPTPIATGVTEVCTGPINADTLSGSIAGGAWTSSNTGVATVGITSGIVTGINSGSATITYTLGSGCYGPINLTVNTTPSVITGPSNVCPSLSISLTDATSFGTWSSTDPSVAIVVASGLVTGVTGGSAVISYIVGTGCGVATTINVNPAPPAITGAFSVCDGYTSTLSDIAPDGIWTSSNTLVAPVNISSGIVSGNSIGTANITYELLSTGCLAVAPVTVNPDPSAILGISNVCVGTTITLSDITPLGVWSSSNTTASIGSSTGIVQGLDSGYTTITYTIGTGCFATYLVRVNLAPPAIAGPANVCVGSIITLSDSFSFGTWSSSNTAVANIYTGTGMLQGISEGTTVITYLLGTGCLATLDVTVNPLPVAITGPSILCVGSTITLSDMTSGGNWSSTNTALGTVDISGDVTGLAPGNDTIVYTLATTGCIATQFLTVSPVLTPVSGLNVLCVGSVDSLTSAPPGGIWSSSNNLIATVGSGTGYAVGVSAGLVTITYTSLSSCNVVATITVNPVPDAIVGLNNLCPGLTTTLFDPTGGGVWSSTNTAEATIGSSGTSTTLTAATAPGTTTISYTISDGCAAILVFSVNPLPYIGPVAGIKSFCVDATSALSDTAAGGVWTSTNTSIATIDGSTGIATGVSAGTVVISYFVVEHCGSDSTSTTIQINPLPFALPISGSPQLCLNTSTQLNDATAGGVWTSSDTAVATINSASGLVYGVSTGSTTISYTYTNSCGSYSATLLASVNVLFSFATITTYPDTPMCSQTFNQNFGALLPEPAGISYSWSVSQGDSLLGVGAYGQYAIISFMNPGRAVVTLSAEILSSGCIIADSFVTTIGSGVSSDPGVQYYLSEFACTDNTQDSYQWGYDDVVTLDSTVIVGEINQTYYNPHPDTLGKNYWVITTKNGCSQKSYYTFNVAVTGVTNVTAGNNEILLFPNPADSKVNIVVKGLNSTDVIDVKLMDMLGREVQTTSLVNGRGVLQVSELPSGVYSVLLLNNGVKIGTKTFVKN